MKLFVEGRQDTFTILKTSNKKVDSVIWFHVASLGEYEQGLPVIERVKELFPTHKIVLSFFSPSGYEVKKNSALADAVVYLPLDTPINARKFLDLINPDLAIFVKYEFWPNILNELKRRNINSLLISGGFREDQIFFKSKNTWFIEPLKAFDHFFVQNEKSEKLLNSIGFKNVSVSGDTRFDRVNAQLLQDNQLNFIKEFIDGKLCVVAGSTWPDDEKFVNEFILQNKLDVKIIIAPHTIEADRIKSFQKSIGIPSITFSEKEGEQLGNYKVMIVDTIGLLSKIYSYADIAFVGGAVGTTGLHNILEPAAFGIPIITGTHIQKFPEAIDLNKKTGLNTVESKKDFIKILNELLQNEEFRYKTGKITEEYIKNNIGATQNILNYLKENYVKIHSN